MSRNVSSNENAIIRKKILSMILPITMESLLQMLHVGVISESDKGWTKEVNLISWNNRDPKYDIRDWALEHEKMGKGITFTKDELRELRDILNDMDL